MTLNDLINRKMEWRRSARATGRGALFFSVYPTIDKKRQGFGV